MSVPRTLTNFLIVAFLFVGIPFTYGQTLLPSTTAAADKLDLGFFAGGTQLQVAVAGQINITGTTGAGDWITRPDGSLVSPVTFGAYSYGNVGATNYPIIFGGNGVNYFSGGGANYDTATGTPTGPFGFAGVESTDTLTSGLARFGSVVGTFSDSPIRTDWFTVGSDLIVYVPDGGAHLYLAINDTNSTNNSGNYFVEVTPVPEPSWLLFVAVVGCSGMRGLSALLQHRRRIFC